MAKKDLTAKGLVVLIGGAAPEAFENIIAEFLTEYTVVALESANKEISKLAGANEKNLTLIAELKESVQTLKSGLAESISASKTEIERLSSENSTANTLLASLTEQREEALSMVESLSAQVAAQSTVNNQEDILVSVDGVKYLLSRADMHTRDGVVKAEDAAKDEAFLKMLIDKESGNIRPAK
ncbi:MAG TPA: hypothetical protein VGB63_13130 [Pedobacter sp.]|jgi:hypothetical protein